MDSDDIDGSSEHGTSPPRFPSPALSPGAGAALDALAERHRLRRSTLIVGAWALLESRRRGEAEVALPTATGDVAPRLTVPPNAGAAGWLRELDVSLGRQSGAAGR